MIDKIITNTSKYTNLHSKDERKNKGQFFTSKNIVEFMTALNISPCEHLDILDPGAGNGLLAAAFVKYCVENNICFSFSVTYVENDTEILPTLNKTKRIIEDYIKRNGGKINIYICEQNFITEYDSKTKFNVVVSNPPYMKIKKDSNESIKMKDYVYGQPNLYGLFMCKAINLLKDNGVFSFITPRSWTSGKYYLLMRKHILKHLNITDLLLFEDRDNVFSNEDVLQETLITIGFKNQSQTNNIKIYNIEKTNLINAIPFDISSSFIKDIGDDHYLLLPSNLKDVSVLANMSTITDTFESLGYCFKTGPVVEFRNKDAISTDKKNGYIPMYRSANIVNGKCVFPANTDKAQYMNSAEKKLLIKNMNTVFLRRLSAKEEQRRLQSCIHYKVKGYKYITVENHVNYLIHSDGSELTREEVEWINEILTSDEYDTYYRIINGSTQVNASELNKLPLQRR